MQTKMMKLADILTATYNPRKDLQPGDVEYEIIKNSIDKFNLVEPLVVNIRNNTLIGGHQRLKILINTGVTETEVSTVDLTPEDEKILNVLLNRARGFWNYDKLIPLLKEIKEAGQLAITGFTDFEFENMTYDYSHIDDLIKESFSDAGKKERETFTITFTLPETEHEAIDNFLDKTEEAKTALSTAVLNHIRGYDG